MNRSYKIYALTAAGDIHCAESIQALLAAVPIHEILAALVSDRYESFFAASVHRSLLEDIASRRSAFVFLIPHRPAPHFAFREDPPVRNFGCTGDILCRAIEHTAPERELLAFDAFTHGAIPSSEFEVYGLQVPIEYRLPIRQRNDHSSWSWIIPHFGESELLRTCLAQTKLADGGETCSRLLLALDGPRSSELVHLIKPYAGIRSFDTSSSPYGPYALRNLLIARSEAEVAIFQDSDDIPCTNRVSGLLQGFASPRVGMVGSHEIRVDNINRQVIPVRYPLDVSAALRLGPSHALLHPTSAVRTELFKQTGGFSTFARHAMDSQFLLRSHFYFSIRNVDSFLYIRRWRAGSLCTNPSTALGTLYRTELMVSWGRAFMQGMETQSIEGTSLVAQASKTPMQIAAFSASEA